MTDHTALAARFRRFVTECQGSSPLYARLAAAVAADPALLALAATARPGQPAPNMLFAAVHALLLAGTPHPLARCYPDLTAPVSSADPAPLFAAFCAEYATPLAALIAARSVQTNEVRRSALLLPALATVAVAAGQPLALIELGPSAGLNLRWDRYGYRYADAALSAPDPDLWLTCEPRGALPLPDALPAVAWRVGVDLSPVDVTDEAAVAWLRALVWPEQPERVALLERAVFAARLDPPRILAGDAITLLPELLAAAPADAALCVFDSFVVNQFTPAGRERLDALLLDHSRTRPLWRVSIGWTHGDAHASIRRTDYCDGAADERLLAHCQPHGAWISWLKEDGKGKRHHKETKN